MWIVSQNTVQFYISTNVCSSFSVLSPTVDSGHVEVLLAQDVWIEPMTYHWTKLCRPEGDSKEAGHKTKIKRKKSQNKPRTETVMTTCYKEDILHQIQNVF